MKELLDSLVILQVECQKYRFLNKHQTIFEIKMPDQFFQNSNSETDFGKSNELNL